MCIVLYWTISETPEGYSFEEPYKAIKSSKNARYFSLSNVMHPGIVVAFNNISAILIYSFLILKSANFVVALFYYW